MGRWYILIFFLLFNMATAFGQQMLMKCVSVDASGDVTITWNNAAPAAGFLTYYIYHSSTAAGPFTLLDSLFLYAPQTYTDVNANANNTNAFYYVILKNTAGVTISSDTIEAIKLTVTKAGNFASLTWNTTHAPLIGTNSVFYEVYREYPVGVWTLIASLDMSILPPNLSDEITICGDTIKYQVKVTDSSGCTSVSNIDGKYFIDKLSPATPILDSVSVDAAGNAVLGWTKSTSKDTYAYVILKCVGNTCSVIDTVIGIDSTKFYTNINATTTPQKFSILALDSCGNPSSYGLSQETILLKGVLDPCSASLKLTWNAYINSPSSPLYSILVSENGGTEMVVGATANTAFIVSGLKTDTAYCFRVRALLDNISNTSTSSAYCIKAYLPTLPQFVYLKRVSVNSASQVEAEAYVDILGKVKEHRLLRGTSPMGSFSVVSTVPGGTNPIVSFVDNSVVDADKSVYYYKVVSTDSCGSVAVSSQISHTIVPTAVANNNFTNTIAWNNYAQWLGGVTSYAILRSVDSLSGFVQIGSVPFGDSTFLDASPDEFPESNGKFCYRIVAYEGAGNTYGFMDSSYSAQVCVEQQTAVYVPNAFRPSSYFNPIFNPVDVFVSYEDYDLKIFDRWGEVIFETTNPAQGWDGTSKNKPCPMDVYTWFLSYKTSNGVAQTKVGSVTLIE